MCVGSVLFYIVIPHSVDASQPWAPKNNRVRCLSQGDAEVGKFGYSSDGDEDFNEARQSLNISVGNKSIVMYGAVY